MRMPLYLTVRYNRQDCYRCDVLSMTGLAFISCPRAWCLNGSLRVLRPECGLKTRICHADCRMTATPRIRHLRHRKCGRGLGISLIDMCGTAMSDGRRRADGTDFSAACKHPYKTDSNFNILRLRCGIDGSKSVPITWLDHIDS